MLDELKKKGFIQCRNLLLDELIMYIRNSSDIPNDRLYENIINRLSQIYFINSQILSEGEYNSRQKRKVHIR